MLAQLCQGYLDGCSYRHHARMHRTAQTVADDYVMRGRDDVLGLSRSPENEHALQQLVRTPYVMAATMEADGFRRTRPFILVVDPQAGRLLVIPATKGGRRARGACVLLEEKGLDKAFSVDGTLFHGPLIQKAMQQKPYCKLLHFQPRVSRDPIATLRYPAITCRQDHMPETYEKLLHRFNDALQQMYK